MVRHRIPGILCAAIAALSFSAASADEAYAPVTKARLENPEPGNWLLYRRTYDGHMFSPLSQITAANVKALRPVWTISTGVTEGHESAPLVNNGVMFVTTPGAQVMALDAKTGDLLWRYKRRLPADLGPGHPTNRGVALWGDRVYVGTLDAHLVALDAKTGKVDWDVPVGDYHDGLYITMAPLALDGKIIIGPSGADLGIRGFIAAFDANDGHQLWKTFTIPGPGEKGHDTWTTDAWKHGGASIWLTPNYDPVRKLIYSGVGNAGPWPAQLHPGDNLYTDSVIAVDPANGTIVSYHQYHQTDSWDWDEPDPPLLINNVTVDGKPIRALVHPARDGYLWLLQQQGDRIAFRWAKPYAFNNVITSIDPQTGRPTYDPNHVLQIGKPIEYCPSSHGAKNWPAASFSSETNLLYIPLNNNVCSEMTARHQEYMPGTIYSSIKSARTRQFATGDHVGELQAWDLNKGAIVWKQNFVSPMWGPVLSTAGGVVFAGGTADREFRAFDAKTGEILWHMKTNSGIIGAPVTYTVDGTQYVAVVSGWGVDSQRMVSNIARAGYKIDPDVPQGGVVWAFALPAP